MLVDISTLTVARQFVAFLSHRVCSKSKMTDATSVAGTAFPRDH